MPSPFQILNVGATLLFLVHSSVPYSLSNCPVEARGVPWSGRSENAAPQADSPLLTPPRLLKHSGRSSPFPDSLRSENLSSFLDEYCYIQNYYALVIRTEGNGSIIGKTVSLNERGLLT